MGKREKCTAKNGRLRCVLEKDHVKQHSTGYGVHWEESKRIPVKKVEFYIEEGRATKSTSVIIELTTEDGRKFWQRHYQFNERFFEAEKEDVKINLKKECKCNLLESSCKCGSLN